MKGTHQVIAERATPLHAAGRIDFDVICDVLKQAVLASGPFQTWPILFVGSMSKSVALFPSLT